jgi:hypothetical protein
MAPPQLPGQGPSTNSPGASTRHTNTHDARNGGAHNGSHNSGDSRPSARLPSGSSAEILPQLQLNLIEIFSYYRFL